MKLALWNKNTKQKPPQNKTQQPKQSSTSLNYSNDSKVMTLDPKTRITRPQKNDKGSTQMFKSQENSTRWLMNKNSPEPPFYHFFGGAKRENARSYPIAGSGVSSVQTWSEMRILSVLEGSGVNPFAGSCMSSARTCGE